jgi:hypothetical protein
MFLDKRKLALFAAVFGCFFFLEIFLFSTHIHINVRINRNEVACPICQLARGAVKFFSADKVVKLQPLILVTVVSRAAYLLVSWSIVEPSPIRGPPAV